MTRTKGMTCTPTLVLSMLTVLLLGCPDDDKQKIRTEGRLLPVDRFECDCLDCWGCIDNGAVKNTSCTNKRFQGRQENGHFSIHKQPCATQGACATDFQVAAQQACQAACVTDNPFVAACDVVPMTAGCSAEGCGGTGTASQSLIAGSEATDSVIELDPSQSSIAMHFEDFDGTTTASGRVFVTGCRTPPCEITLSLVEISGANITKSRTIGICPICETFSSTLKGIKALNDGAIPAAIGAGNRFTMDGRARFLTNFNVDGDTPGSTEVFASGSPTGTYDPASGTFTLDGVWLGPAHTIYDGLSITVHFVGQFINRAPVADAGPDQIVECNRPAAGLTTLDGTASRDPDGDPVRITWQVGSPALNIASGLQPSLEFPLGKTTTVVASVDDLRGAIDAASVAITVRDTTKPVITPTSSVIDVCSSRFQEVTVPAPDVFDICTPGAITPRGEVISIHGVPISPAISLVDFKATLPLGLVVVRWTATDPTGNVGTLDQTIEIRNDVTTACCTAAQVVISGTPGRDVFRFDERPDRSYCVLGLQGNDELETETHDNFLSGAEGSDELEARGTGGDTLVGGLGDDELEGGHAGTLKAYGGPGDDEIDGELADSAEIFGNEGNDLIHGSLGDDDIFPGPGKDHVFASFGNDRVTILHVCEVARGEILDGGPGNDTLVTPVPVDTLRSLGVIVTGFETVIVDDANARLSECF